MKGFDPQVAAVSPIYCAPELFIAPDRSPYNFDVFSAGLIWFSYAMRLADAKQIASFKQQLELADFDLNFWLQANLRATVRADGHEEGLRYFSRYGCAPWRLVARMLTMRPEDRPSAAECLAEVEKWQVEEGKGGGGAGDEGEVTSVDSFIKAIFSSSEDGSIGGGLDSCEIPSSAAAHTVTTQFRAGRPLGLVLADDAMRSGVYVMEVSPRTQAERNGRALVGDRLVSVNGVRIRNFEQARNAIVEAPTTILSLKFERQGVAAGAVTEAVTAGSESGVEGEQAQPATPNRYRSRLQRVGASSKAGRRKYNEDAVVAKSYDSGSFVVGGVFDGHGGGAASGFCEQNFLKELEKAREGEGAGREQEEVLRKAWKEVSDGYMATCEGGGDR